MTKHYRVHFWASDRREGDVVYRLRARSLPDVRKALPTLLARHLGERRHMCRFDGWSVLTVVAPVNLHKIVLAGGIQSGRITDQLPDTYPLADRDLSRDGGRTRRAI